MAVPMAAKIGRGLISARTGEALRAGKAIGLPLGQPKGSGRNKLDYFRAEIMVPVANGFIAKRCGATSANLSNRLESADSKIRRHEIRRRSIAYDG